MASRISLPSMTPNASVKRLAAGMIALVSLALLSWTGYLQAPAGASEHALQEAPPEVHGMESAPQVHVVHMAGETRVMAQNMVMEVLLAALGSETERRLQELKDVRARCAAILRSLRHGDESLALAATTNPKVLENLDKVDYFWTKFDAVIQASTDVGLVTAEQVRTVATVSQPLVNAMDKMVASYEYFAYGGRTFSVLSRTVSAAEAQGALVHRMTREYLLVVYGHEVGRNRIRLAESTALFDRTLKGLISGDTELQVLPAPSQALKEQFKAVRSVWDEYLPLVTGATGSAGANPEKLERVARQGRRLAAEVSAAVELYHKL